MYFAVGDAARRSRPRPVIKNRLVLGESMGLLVDGVWHDQWYDTAKTGGRFVREDSRFRNWVTADGSPGPTGKGGFKAEPGRYHLYVSYACPWAHRTLIFRAIKRLENIVSVSVVDPRMGNEGWVLGDFPGSTPDTVLGKQRLYEVYLAANPDYSGRSTVPILWDKEQGTIVSNESSEIIRMFNLAFDAFTDAGEDYYPASRREEIDAINARIYDTVNNGVYKAGFATRQDAYEGAVKTLFETLDELEERVSRSDYLVTNNNPTEADWRLFTTLIRFDAVYFGHFKCNIRRIADYRYLRDYIRRLYSTPSVASTVHIDHIKTHYYWSHTTINPTRIVPVGPETLF
jgi:putative glutathione S-transferase